MKNALSLTSFLFLASFLSGAPKKDIVDSAIEAGNFSTLPDSAKWIMSFAMLLGRLEIFTVLVMLNPAFWQR